MTKVCQKCGIEKDVTSFHKDISKKDGFKNTCKNCSSEYTREYYKIHHNKVSIEYKRKWNKKNKEKINSKARKRYRENKAKYSEARKRWRENHKEQSREADKKYVNKPEIAAKLALRRLYGLIDIPRELIDIKAKQIRLIRAVRDKRLEEKGNE